MITKEQKIEIGRRIIQLKDDLGGWAKAATRLGVNQSHARYNMIEEPKWGAVSDSMWVKVAGKLGISLSETPWQLVETTNSRQMEEYLYRAQNERMFMAISHQAGQGKSAGVVIYQLYHEAVFYIECEESWSHKQFVLRLAQTLAIPTHGIGTNVAVLTDAIIAALKNRSATGRPLLVVDEANKLKPSSLRLFIPLFNKLQGQVGMVLIGAHDLKKQIQGGVRRDARGFDELESRLGRTYWPLVGIFEQDVREICEANGVADIADQQRIWDRMKPDRKPIGGEYQWLATQDLRVLQQAIIHTRVAKMEQAGVPKDKAKRPFVPPTEMEAQMGGRTTFPAFARP